MNDYLKKEGRRAVYRKSSTKNVLEIMQPTVEQHMGIFKKLKNKTEQRKEFCNPLFPALL